MNACGHDPWPRPSARCASEASANLRKRTKRQMKYPWMLVGGLGLFGLSIVACGTSAPPDESTSGTGGSTSDDPKGSGGAPDDPDVVVTVPDLGPNVRLVDASTDLVAL